MNNKIAARPVVEAPTLIKAACLGLATSMVLGFALAWPILDENDFRIALCLMAPAAVALVAPVLTAAAYRPYDVFHPLNFVALSIFFGVFGRALFLLTSRTAAAQELLEGYPLEAIVPGAILSAAGSALICLGFAAAGKASWTPSLLSGTLANMDLRQFRWLLPVFFIVSAVATYVFVQSTGFSYTGIASLSTKRRVVINGVESSMGYHRLLAQDLSKVILLMLITWYLRSRSRSPWFPLGLGLFGTLAIALPFLASSRANVLLTVISICVVVNRVRRISLTTLAICVLVCAVTLTGMLALRRENQRGQAASDTVLSLGMEPFFGNKNFACLVKLGHVYKAVPDLIPYHYGSTYLTFLYAPIPRALWEDKPAVLMGRMITEKIYNRGLDMKDKGGGTPPGLFSEAIINFGVFGFPVIAFLGGFGLRFLDNSLGRLADESIAGLGLYAAVIPAFTLQLLSGEFSTAAIKLGVGVVTVLLIVLSTRVKLFSRRAA